MLATLVETEPTQRLANFQYAAPEQRAPRNAVTATADIYALGLILNEMFTGAVPHGTGYRMIASVSPESAFLDEVVARMIRQTPGERPSSIAEVKALIQRHRAEAVSMQRLSTISGTVVKAGEIDEPLAHDPPRLIGADWNGGMLTLKLDRPVTQDWINALHSMGNYTSVMGIPPTAFQFRGEQATISAQEHNVQSIVDYFKQWLPNATNVLKHTLAQRIQQQEAAQREKLQREKAAEEQRLRVNRNIRI